jgi:UDP-N-acetyl-alpha-D-muramoyl-L-alanyl-L-glutamate epimerase
MKTYSSFHFSGYFWNHHAGKIVLRYALDRDITFEETIKLPEPVSDERLQERGFVIDRLLDALHIIGGMSYYKTSIPKKMVLDEQTLTKKEAKFWNTVYEKGLGEFFYKNQIDFHTLINFPADAKKESRKLSIAERKKKQHAAENLAGKRVLVPIGGGKDSMVTIELLRKAQANITLLRMGEDEIITELANRAGLPILNIKRTLPDALFDMNAQGALNGHVPISAYLSILSVLVAELYGFDAVMMSNERSANAGNLIWRGMEVNHQWSKSLEFEEMLQLYLAETIGTTVDYCSALRPLSELSIAKMFSAYPQYFNGVTSCNKNWKIQEDDEEVERTLWCNKCPKCAFVYALFAAFIEPKTLIAMFGANLLDSEELLKLYTELLGLEGNKPFECVGTPEEVTAALLLAKHYPENRETCVMKMFDAEVLPSIKNPDHVIEACLNISDEHCIPEEYRSIVLAMNSEISLSET